MDSMFTRQLYLKEQWEPGRTVTTIFCLLRPAPGLRDFRSPRRGNRDQLCHRSEGCTGQWQDAVLWFQSQCSLIWGLLLHLSAPNFANSTKSLSHQVVAEIKGVTTCHMLRMKLGTSSTHSTWLALIISLFFFIGTSSNPQQTP